MTDANLLCGVFRDSPLAWMAPDATPWSWNDRCAAPQQYPGGLCREHERALQAQLNGIEPAVPR